MKRAYEAPAVYTRTVELNILRTSCFGSNNAEPQAETDFCDSGCDPWNPGCAYTGYEGETTAGC